MTDLMTSAAQRLRDRKAELDREIAELEMRVRLRIAARDEVDRLIETHPVEEPAPVKRQRVGNGVIERAIMNLIDDEHTLGMDAMLDALREFLPPSVRNAARRLVADNRLVLSNDVYSLPAPAQRAAE
jgi:hypothetical protein